MFLGMIDRTPYDVRWRMFGIYVRVHPFFWLTAFVFSWYLNAIGLQWLVLGVACVFLSVLLHELGHVLAFRCFGINSYIVLIAFGGVAIPDGSAGKRWQRIVVSAAGPAIQLVLWGLLWAVNYFYLPPIPTDLTMAKWFVIYEYLMFINLALPLLNLLPIWPLDGGQISREVFQHYSRDTGVIHSLYLSMVVSAVLALHAFLSHANKTEIIPYLPVGIYPGVFFLMFFMTSLQALQMENARSQWYDDHRWN